VCLLVVVLLQPGLGRGLSLVVLQQQLVVLQQLLLQLGLVLLAGCSEPPFRQL
jgi:hypothetical protein